MTNAIPKILVVIPALNEASTVGLVVEDLRRVRSDVEILVVDDGSSDRTGGVARDAGARVARHPVNLGVGAAMRTGFRYAEMIGATVVVQIDADGQHDPRQMDTLITAVADADIVVGSRFLEPGGYRISWARRMAIRVLSRAVSVPCRTLITDATSGFRATGQRGIALFASHYPTEYLADTVESLALAGRVGLAVREVAVVMLPRQGGSPSQSFPSLVTNLVRALFVAFQSLVLRLPPDAKQLVGDG